MNKCLLCQQKEADKTGSHIIPSFLMKRINGDGKRDHEIGFKIRSGIIETYFGRDIYEDKRKKITDYEEKLYSRENYDVKDYIFCKKCEDYFSSLESKYAPCLELQFSKQENTKNKRIPPLDAILFWCSIVWRVSVTRHLGIRLNSNLEERLRIALESNSIDNLNIKYALFRCKDYSKKSKKGTLVCMDIKDKNIVLFVDDFILIMIFDIEEKIHETKLLEIGIKLKIDSLNDGKKIEEIAPIPPEEFSQLMFSIIQITIANMQLPKRFKDLHMEIFKDKLPENILYKILTLTQSSWKLGDKYTHKHYAWCYKEILIKHGLLRENEDNTFTIFSKK